jgi:hypothetical protein
MGNFNFKQPLIPAGSTAVIVHDKFTVDQEIPNSVLRIGEPVKIIHTVNMLKSRPGAKDITVSKVLMKDGKTYIYFTNNLKPVSKKTV